MRQRAFRLVVLLLAVLTLIGPLETATGQEFCRLRFRCRNHCPNGEWFWSTELYRHWECCRVYPDGGQDCNGRWDRTFRCCT